MSNFVTHLLLMVTIQMFDHLAALSGICDLPNFQYDFNSESETPIDSSLNISPSCQTLSKALDIFQEYGKHQKLCISL